MKFIAYLVKFKFANLILMVIRYDCILDTLCIVSRIRRRSLRARIAWRDTTVPLTLLPTQTNPVLPVTTVQHVPSMTDSTNVHRGPSTISQVSAPNSTPYKPCPAGHYCPARTKYDRQYKCPQGTFNNLTSKYP